jgi:OMF family outer membrane factor
VNQPSSGLASSASRSTPAIKKAQTTVAPLLQPNQSAPTSSSPSQSAPASDLPAFSNPVVEPVAKPIGPAKAGAAPEYLNPDPNPLSFPTKPEEVRLRGIQPITLQQALDLAERNSLTLQTARLQQNRSRFALDEARAALYPTLNLQSTLTRSLSPNASAGSSSALSQLLGLGSSQNQLNRSFLTSAALSYDIFTSGRRPAQIRAAGQQLRSDQLQVEITREQLRLDITNAYYDVQQADANVGIGRAAVRNAQISLRDALALERAGIGTRFDVLRAQVQLANSQQQLTNALSQQQINRRQLAQLLNISPSINLAAADPVEAAGEWNLSLDDSIVLAFRNRAELEQQLAQRELAEQNKRAALSQLGPTLSVSTQYQVQNSISNGTGFLDGYSVQAGVAWQLFDGGAARSRANQQEANIAIAETNFANTRNQVRFQVEQAYSNLSANRVNISTARAAVDQATEALRLARLRFQAGVGTQTDVINAETDLTNAQGNLVSAILGYNRSLATLQRAITNLPIPTGGRSPSPTPAPPSPSLLNQGNLQPSQPNAPTPDNTSPNGTTTAPNGSGGSQNSPGAPSNSTSPPSGGAGSTSPSPGGTGTSTP